MRRQKGQAVVEFALVLPLFLMLVFGVMFTGLLYSDYLTLQNWARDSARTASISGEDSYSVIRGKIQAAANGGQLFVTDLYSLNTVNIATVDSSVVVTLTAKRNRNANFPGADFIKGLLPENLKAEYSMYREDNVNNGTST